VVCVCRSYLWSWVAGLEQSNRIGEPRNTTALQAVQDPVEIAGRVSKVSGLLREHLVCNSRQEIELIEEELVGMLDPDSCREESIFGKVLDVERHDDLRASPDRGCQDVPIVVVWKIEAGGHLFPPLDEGVFERRVHGVEPATNAERVELGVHRSDCPCGFVEYPLRPQRPVEAPLCKPDKGVAQRVGNEHTGIEEN